MEPATSPYAEASDFGPIGSESEHTVCDRQHPQKPLTFSTKPSYNHFHHFPVLATDLSSLLPTTTVAVSINLDYCLLTDSLCGFGCPFGSLALPCKMSWVKQSRRVQPRSGIDESGTA